MLLDQLETTAPLTWRQIIPMVLGRLTCNTAFRMIYPLLTFLAAGLAVDLQTASLLVTVQVGATLISPLGGILSDARGERTTMIWGLIVFSSGTLICALARQFWPFLLGYGLIGFGTALYLPALQAYASARTSYARRGRVLGILELGWALSALLGVTFLTYLVEARNAWAPAFWVLLGMALLLLLWTLLRLPKVKHVRATGAAGGWQLSLRVIRQPVIWAALIFLVCIMVAMELLFVSYAGWLEEVFGATVEQLGLVFGLLGVAELGGAATAALLTDRLGKRRAVVTGFAAAALFQALLPLSAGNWALFMVLFLCMGFCSEFAIVSTFPLLSGIVPTARGTVLALGVSAIGMGRVIGSRVSVPLWRNAGFLANGLLAGGLSLLGALICLLLVQEGESAEVAEVRRPDAATG
ncbi:MAG: MFS transporter [Chloroflexaceae bacterium]